MTDTMMINVMLNGIMSVIKNKNQLYLVISITICIFIYRDIYDITTY